MVDGVEESAVASKLRHFHGFGWNTVPCLTAVALGHPAQALLPSCPQIESASPKQHTHPASFLREALPMLASDYSTATAPALANITQAENNC